MTSCSHCQTSQSHSPAARGSKQKFDNDYDVIFMCYKCNLEYNIQVLTIEMTGRKPLCIRVQITAVTSAFYFMPVLCVLYSKTLKR